MQYPSNVNNVYLGWRNIIRCESTNKLNSIVSWDNIRLHTSFDKNFMIEFSLQVRDSLRLATAEATEYQQSIARRVSNIVFSNLSI